MSTAIKLGNDYWKLKKDNVELPVVWSEDRVSNHHVGVAGTSGAGTVSYTHLTLPTICSV